MQQHLPERRIRMSIKRINKLTIVDQKTQSELEREKLKIITLKYTLIGLITIIGLVSIIITYFVQSTASEFPDVSRIAETTDQTSIIYDINDKPIANIHGDEDRVSISLDKVSPWLQRAVIAIEDNRFYEHNGIDLIGTIRAAFTNFSGGEMQGGSTLTQ